MCIRDRHAPHLLSGGQKQRVAIAGVIAMRPRCIVLDEPTLSLIHIFLRLGKVCVQADMILPRQLRTLQQQLARNGERRARSQRDLPHGAIGRIVPALDQRGAVLQNGAHALHDAVGRQAAVLHGQVHAAARGDHAHAELVGRRKLRAEQITAPGREDIVAVSYTHLSGHSNSCR